MGQGIFDGAREISLLPAGILLWPEGIFINFEENFLLFDGHFVLNIEQVLVFNPIFQLR